MPEIEQAHFLFDNADYVPKVEVTELHGDIALETFRKLRAHWLTPTDLALEPMQ